MYKLPGGIQILGKGIYLGGSYNFILQISVFEGANFTITDQHRTPFHVVILSKIVTAFEVCFYDFLSRKLEPVEARYSCATINVMPLCRKKN